MAACSIDTSTFTGADFIAALGGQITSVGSFDAAAIDNDIATNGDFSQVGICVTQLYKWLHECQIPTDMAANLCLILKQGFKFMVLYSYYNLFIDTQAACGCKCEEHEIAMLDRLKEYACRFFCQISICLKKRFLAWIDCSCIDTVQPTFDFSAFGVSKVTDNCITDTSYTCDSCGC